MIDLDYQASTPLAPEVREAMLPWLTAEGSANPHSAHAAGRKAKAAIEAARESILALCPPGGSLFFTSGATEALNWAIKGTTGAIVTAATEHAAVLDTVEAEARRGRPVTILPVDGEGKLDPAAIETAAGPGMLATMLVNNEIGVVHPVDTFAAIARARGALVLCDAVQGFGRVPLPQGCDLIAISAHKVHGPKGIGALWARDGVALEPLLHGGGQEGGLRSGTLSPALCVGFGEAARLMQVRHATDAAHVEGLWQAALQRLGGGWQVNGTTVHRYLGNLNIRRDGLDAGRLISEVRGVAFSAGSACASGSGRPSHVLKAIGLTDAQARSSIRLGFGRYTTWGDLETAIDLISEAAARQEGLV